MFRSIFSYGRRQLHVLSTQTIKPAIPTPSHLKRYNLSLTDMFTSSVYMPIIFHYPNHINSGTTFDTVDKSNQLKSSLSQILTKYYPFAGRLNNAGAFVNCNDEGIEFQDISFQYKLSEVLKMPDHQARGLIYPQDSLLRGALNNDGILLVVQLIHFQCGGISVVVFLSHKLGDARTFLTFMNSWATETRSNYRTGHENLVMYSPPHFISNPSNNIDVIAPKAVEVLENDSVTRKFVFPNSKVARLKAIINASTGLQNTSRVDALTALIYKCANAVNATTMGFFSPTLLMHLMNMRPNLLPPLPETTIGNLFTSTNITTPNESENSLNLLVEKIKKGKANIQNVGNLDALNMSKLQELENKNCKFFMSSSISRMQFYQVDFGWGNPIRVTLADSKVNNGFLLMDTPNGDGIEALVSLDKDDMATFQNDKEIHAFSSSSSLTELS